MRASEIRDRARSLADLQNSQAITYSDEVRSLNESYKDIYNQLCVSDYDYFVEEIVMDDWSTYVDPEDSHTYNIPLPEDFYQLRFVDYQDNDQWRPMLHMNVNQRNTDASDPVYRLKNTKIWMKLGSSQNMPSKIKISYYPVPASITLPDQPLTYAQTVSPTFVNSITNNWYISEVKDATLNTYSPDIMLYNYQNTLVAESLINQETTVILSQNVLQLEYAKGYIYYLGTDNQIYKAAFDPSAPATLVPTQITLSGQSISGILTFNLQDNLLYASNTYEAVVAVPGASPYTYTASYLTGAPVCAYYVNKIADGWYAWLDASMNLAVWNGTTITVVDTSVWLNLAGDGSRLFGLDSKYNVYQLDFDLTVPSVTKTQVTSDCLWIGGISGDRLSVVRHATNGVEAITAAVDYDLEYPSNVLYEIMSYQMAIDFKRKYDSANPALATRQQELWQTFMHSMVKQDQYKVERIQNVRLISSNYNWIR